MNVTSVPRARRASATASAGTTCPAVPPAAITTLAVGTFVGASGAGPGAGPPGAGPSGGGSFVGPCRAGSSIAQSCRFAGAGVADDAHVRARARRDVQQQAHRGQ